MKNHTNERMALLAASKLMTKELERIKEASLQQETATHILTLHRMIGDRDAAIDAGRAIEGKV